MEAAFVTYNTYLSRINSRNHFQLVRVFYIPYNCNFKLICTHAIHVFTLACQMWLYTFFCYPSSNPHHWTRLNIWQGFSSFYIWITPACTWNVNVIWKTFGNVITSTSRNITGGVSIDTWLTVLGTCLLKQTIPSIVSHMVSSSKVENLQLPIASENCHQLNYSWNWKNRANQYLWWA